MADGHQLQSRLFASLGLSKLADKYAEHADEERGWVTKCIDRLLDLGAEVRLEDKKAAWSARIPWTGSPPPKWLPRSATPAAQQTGSRVEKAAISIPRQTISVDPKRRKKPPFFQRFHLTSCEFFV